MSTFNDNIMDVPPIQNDQNVPQEGGSLPQELIEELQNEGQEIFQDFKSVVDDLLKGKGILNIVELNEDVSSFMYEITQLLEFYRNKAIKDGYINNEMTITEFEMHAPMLEQIFTIASAIKDLSEAYQLDHLTFSDVTSEDLEEDALWAELMESGPFNNFDREKIRQRKEKRIQRTRSEFEANSSGDFAKFLKEKMKRYHNKLSSQIKKEKLEGMWVKCTDSLEEYIDSIANRIIVKREYEA